MHLATRSLKGPKSASTIFHAIKMIGSLHGEEKHYCSTVSCVFESMFDYL